jgi:small-conductance mechanosensitive channel
MGFDSEFVTRLMATSVVLFVAFFLLWVVQKLGYGLKHRLNVIRDRNALYHDRFRYYARAIRYVGYFIVSLFALYTLFIVWGVTDMSTAIDEWGRALIGEVLSIFIIVLFALGIWEFLNTVMERYIQSLDSVNSSRLLTVLPIIKNVFFVAFVILFSLVILSQIGINIVPLLAGAGVLGIAIGFGAQTMVKDFLTGFKTGVIERITIRKVQMRDLSGTVFTIPFGEITIVENLTKEFSFFCTDVGVAYRENTDEVIEYIREVDEDLRSDEDFKDLITEPLEVLGVDAFADSAVMIKVRMKTRPIKQWAVGREFNRRIKLKFDEMGVEIPFPHQTIYFG